MPVYEYDCAACGRRFSRFFRSASAAEGVAVACECGSADTRRAISAFQLHFSLKSQIDRIDPRIDQEIDAAMAPHKATDPLNRIDLGAMSDER